MIIVYLSLYLLILNKENNILCLGGLQLFFLSLPLLVKFLIQFFHKIFIEFYFYHYRFYYENERGRILAIILLALSGVEFVIAFSAAIFTCQVACCDESGCCGDSQKGKETDIGKEHSMKHSAYMHLTE